MKGLLDDIGAQGRVVEAGGDPVGDGGFEIGLVENGAQGKPGKRRLRGDHRLGLAAQAVPDRVKNADFLRGRRLEACLRHGRFSLPDRRGLN